MVRQGLPALFRLFILRCALVLLVTAATEGYSPAASQMDVTKIDANYIDRFVNLTVEWQSLNPVLKILVSAGLESRTITVDEFDNRRNTSGYHGTVTLQLLAEPHNQQAGIPYAIQLEDDLRQRSQVFSGKVPVASAQVPIVPQREDTWGQANIKTSQGQPLQGGRKSTDTIDKLLVVADRFDLTPSMDDVTVHILSSDNVSFSSKANDDKGLLEVRFRVYDEQGALVAFQSVNSQGKVWQGSSQTFMLGGGSFQVLAQAVDSSGNTSKEQRASFTLSGNPRELMPLQEPPFLLPTRATSASPSSYDQQIPQQNPVIYPDQTIPQQPSSNQPQPAPYPAAYQPAAPNQPPPMLPPPPPNAADSVTPDQQLGR